MLHARATFAAHASHAHAQGRT